MDRGERVVTRAERRPATRARRLRRARAEAFLGFGGSEQLPHLAGLDGLRGLAVAAVVVFHGGFGWLTGGYLGVSLFFTLSGFLITSLLLRECERSGAVELRRFWQRRFRRLLPAAWLTLIGIGVAAVALDDISPGLRGDLWSAAANVANWRFLWSGTSYADLFTTRSPALHFWSLAIEEQFYLAFPVLFWGLWKLTGGRRRRLGALLGVVAAASFSVPIVRGWSVDRTYYGTDTRAGELLTGATLALLVSSPAFRRLLVRRWWWRSAMSAVGGAALAAVVALWVLVREGDPRIAAGLLPIVAATSAALILSAAMPSGVVHRVSGTAPLRWLGRISYGVYLFHWPVLVWSGASRPGPQHAVRFVIAVTAVLVVAEMSHRLIESPIRRSGWSPPALRPAAALTALALLAGPAVLATRVDAAQDVLAGLDDAAARYSMAVPPGAPTVSGPLAAPDSAADRSPSVVLTAPPTVTPPGPLIPERPVVSFFGDSIALSLAMSMGYWNHADSNFVDGKGVTRLGCGVIPGGALRYDRVRSMPRDCDDWATSWPFVVRAAGTDVAVVHSCQWETIARRYPGMETFVAPGDPAADETIRRGYRAAIDLLRGSGVELIVWVRCPHFSQVNGVRRLAVGLRESRDPTRIDRLNQLIEEVAAEQPGIVRTLAWDAAVNPRVDDAVLRPDGSHYQWKTDTGIAAEFGPALLEVIAQARG